MDTPGKTVTIATKHSGVYKRVSKKRRNPKDGKPDEGFFITVRTIEGGKYVKSWLCVGWKSTDGMNADKANDILLAVKRQMKTGELPKDIFDRIRDGGPIEFELDTQDIQKNIMLTFGEAWEIFCEKWLVSLSRPDDEKGRYKNHLQPRFEHTPLDKIKSLDLETLKLEMSDKGFSAGTIKHVLGLVSRVYHKMTAWEYYDGRHCCPKQIRRAVRYF